MKLTARQALEICIELWTWLRDNPGMRKGDWPEWKKYGEMTSDCPLCKYVIQEDFLDSCSMCPIYWRSKPNLRNHCTRCDSPYDKWCATESVRSQRFYAGKIVKLAEEALERLGE